MLKRGIGMSSNELEITLRAVPPGYPDLYIFRSFSLYFYFYVVFRVLRGGHPRETFLSL